MKFPIRSLRFRQLFHLAREGNAEAIGDLWREFDFHFERDAS